MAKKFTAFFGNPAIERLRQPIERPRLIGLGYPLGGLGYPLRGVGYPLRGHVYPLRDQGFPLRGLGYSRVWLMPATLWEI